MCGRVWQATIDSAIPDEELSDLLNSFLLPLPLMSSPFAVCEKSNLTEEAAVAAAPFHCLNPTVNNNLEDKERKHSSFKDQLSREQRYLKRRFEQLATHYAMSKRRSVSECSSSTVSSSHSTASSAPSPISESGEYKI
ncbi:unnamed protein product [Brassicogethes aeneus]|uniref:Uncharacterized protein n=1 Tax=Brassicogethes aeneus TaxID=1431903 RepID=A0A9P0FEC2_BRAAE|nr:unnamed protein product [Brassicogethes aeneus]